MYFPERKPTAVLKEVYSIFLHFSMDFVILRGRNQCFLSVLLHGKVGNMIGALENSTDEWGT